MQRFIRKYCSFENNRNAKCYILFREFISSILNTGFAANGFFGRRCGDVL